MIVKGETQLVNSVKRRFTNCVERQIAKEEIQWERWWTASLPNETLKKKKKKIHENTN